MKKAPLLIFLFVFLQNISAQNYQTFGKEFWFGYMENLDLNFNGDPDFSVYVFSEESGEGLLSAPATGFNIPFNYEANVMKKVQLPASIFYDIGSEDIEDFGLKVDVSTDAQVFAYHYRVYFSEASSVLPIEALGTEYRVTAALDFNNAISSPSSFLVIATEDDTEVEITPSGLTLGLKPAGTPFNITLNAGQSYQIQSNEDLSGSLVRSTNNKKLALFGGAKQGNIGCSTSDSHIYDNLLPVKFADTSYPLIPFAGQDFSVFKITATEGDTELFLGNNSPAFAQINAGEYHEIELADPEMLTSSKPVHVAQFCISSLCSGSGFGDPNMLTLAPSQMRIRKTGVYNFDRFDPEPYSQQTKRYLTLFTDVFSTDAVELNGQDLGPNFISFPGFPEYAYAQVELDTGAMVLNCPNGVLAYAHGFGAYDAYTYHLAYESPTMTSSKNLDLKDDLAVWPKPFVDQLQLKNNGTNKIDELKLFDLNGLEVYTLKEMLPKANLIWDLGHLPVGVYFLQYEVNGVLLSQKVVKVK